MAEDREEPSETVNELFDALRRSRRRYALYYLRDRETVALEELATVVAGWKQARAPDPEIVTPDDRKQVLASLHHADLPRLDDAGLLRYDLDSKTVTLETLPEIADAVLEKALVYERRADRTADSRIADDRTTDDSESDHRESNED